MKSSCFKWDSMKWYPSSTFHYMWPGWKCNGIFVSSNAGRELILIFHKPPGKNTQLCRIRICCSPNLLAKSLVLSCISGVWPDWRKMQSYRLMCHRHAATQQQGGRITECFSVAGDQNTLFRYRSTFGHMTIVLIQIWKNVNLAFKLQ